MNAERAALISKLDQTVQAALATTRALTDAQVRLPSADEGWPLVIVAYHIGLGLRRQAGWIARALTADAPFAFDWEGTHELNRVIAQEHGTLPKDDAVREIEQAWARLLGVIERMEDGDWPRDVFAFNGRLRSADVVLSRIMLRHVTDHLESMRRTLAAARAGAS